MISGKRLAKTLANVAHHKLAFDIELLDVRKICSYADFFLIMSGKNKMHLDALRASFEEYFAERDKKVLSVEGAADSGWIILDLGDIIVHLFGPEKRGYYNIGSLWVDAEPVDVAFSEKPPAKKKAAKPAAKKAKKV